MSERIQQMRFNSKLTWGLAWAGLAVVLVVPSADFLTGQFSGKGKTTTAMLTSTTDPVKTGSVKKGATDSGAVTKTASVTTKVTKNGVSIVPNPAPAQTTQVASNSSGAPVLDPVNKLVKSGKKLPDYISDGDDTMTTGSIATTTKTPAATTANSTTQVAAIDPAATATPPVPFPHRPPDVARSVLPKPAQSTQPAVIVDEQALATQEAAVVPDQLDVGDGAGPVPPAGIPDDWRTIRQRKLMRYLEQNGLIDGASPDGRSSASVTVIQKPSSDYDPDGFYLSDGPNESRAARRARIERMLEEQSDDPGFTLF